MVAMNMRGALVLLVALSVTGLTGAFAVAAPAQKAASSTTGPSYPSAEAAVTALVDALRNDQLGALQTVLGPGSEKLLRSGDKYADAAERQKFLAAYDERHEMVTAAPDHVILQVGKDNWPLPIPLVQADGRWHFDSAAGAQELVNRRIGRNEIAAIRSALAYVDAQKAFFAFTGQSGEAEYAQRLVSSPGKYDGLYWPTAEGQPESPLEPLMAQAKDEGYPGERIAGKPLPYQGYFFRILTGQGVSTSDGARNYISNSRMTKGFALVAWPASYGTSGIMSFIVNQEGGVFQKDLGPHTAATASAMKLFDPDLTWARVDLVQ
jgi:hypothetical protein